MAIQVYSPPVPAGRLSKAVALAVVLAVLVAQGLGYRALSRGLSRTGDTPPLPKGTLARLPLAIDNWTGRDVPLDERIVRGTAADDCINRNYSRGGAGQTVALFIAYGVRSRDLMPHRPEVCYPGNGWTIADSKTIDLALEFGSTLPCKLYKMSKTGLSSTTATVLNYYIVDGKTCPDESLLRSKAWRGASIDHLIQVQILAVENDASAGGSGLDATRDFAAKSAPEILSLLSTARQSPASAPASSRKAAP